MASTHDRAPNTPLVNEHINRVPTLEPDVETLDDLERSCQVAEVRLPHKDNRQPLGQGTRGVEVDKLINKFDGSSFTPNSSPPTSPFLASTVPSTASSQSDLEFHVSSKSVYLDNNSSTSPTSHPFDTHTSTSLIGTQRSSRGEQSPTGSGHDMSTVHQILIPEKLGVQRGGRPRDQSNRAGGQEFQQERGTRYQKAHKGQDLYQTVAVGQKPSQKGLEACPRTPRQSKSPNILDLTPNTPSRPVVKLPRGKLQMSGPWKPVGKTDNGRRPNIHIQHPSSGPFNTNTHRLSQHDWTTWQELSVKISNLPPSTTTRDLYRCFIKEGTIVTIEIFENMKGQREGKAAIRFSPPPKIPFGKHGHYLIPIAAEGTVKAQLSLEAQKRTFKHTSPFNKDRKYDEIMSMKASTLCFGMLLNPNTMMSMCNVLTPHKNGIQFRLNMLHREITIEFLLDIKDPRTGRSNAKAPQLGKDNRQERIRFRIPFSQLDVIHRIETEDDKIDLLISLESPPRFFKNVDPGETHADDAKYWVENDSWYRQTEIVYAKSFLKKSPLILGKTRPVIDPGRWTTYRLVFEKSKNSASLFSLITQALQDYNIEILPLGHLETPTQLNPPVWQYLDKSLNTQAGAIADLLDLDGDDMSQLAFHVRYQLEVCISNGYLNEYNLGKDFVSRLKGINAVKAQDLLEYVANQGKRVFNPMSLFELNIAEGGSMRAKIPHYCVFIRSATVTPTAVYYQTPVPETSNRVIRQYSQHADRFLRVRFTEEKTEGALYATDKDTMNEVFSRVKRVLTNGIVIGNRKYEFLACGNSQFREHGSYFFAPLPHLPTEKIRNWMGMFTDIKTVPLYLARLGQCFSTTRAIQSAKTTLQEMEDIKRNGYNFTDGVGKISPLLAHLAASELGILQHLEEPPSVFQIRAGGCKGVVAVWPTPAPAEIYIRRSQYKFPATHDGLEIIRWSQFACANLNRQLILILSALGVTDDVFSRKLRLQLSDLERAMTDEKMALAILQKEIDHNQMTLVIASMILDGFQKIEEPFVGSLLRLWRAWSIKYLKEKARITISNGALLLGCVDETGHLEGHFDDDPSPPIDAPTDVKAKYVPEVFVQITRNSESKPEVIIGPMLLARNPSLHPGDIRVVCGVDVPELRHLKNVVVLPQTGDRDIASMCSGGDLDGDDFLVIWDQDLLPREWNLAPMDYSRPPMVKHGRNIGIDDLTTFFVTYMKNDTLSRIAQAHLANADYLEQGVKDEKCLKLAALHSMAVDYVKTGHPAQMPRELRIQKRPHFMDNTYSRKENTYVSQKVLGQLYDQVERVDFVPRFTAPFDDRLLSAYENDEALLTSASEIKKGYDAHMRRIMAQHEIKTEFEVWSTFVLDHSRITNDFKFHEQIGQISTALKEQFKALCIERAGGKLFQQLGPFVAAMYKVTADEMTQAVRECQQVQVTEGQSKASRRMTPANMPLMSFPWLFQDILGKIAKNSEQGQVGQDVKAESAAREALLSARMRRTPGHTVRLDALNDLETADGNTTHKGDLLELFEDSHIHK